MNQWYQTSVKFTKEFPDGTLKRVTENYLFQAVSYTDAEARVYEEVGEFVRGEFLVTGIKQVFFADIFLYESDEIFFIGKIDYVTEDADSGKEKKISNSFLVSAPNVSAACDRIIDSLKDLMSSFEITSVAKSKIIEIFPAKEAPAEK